ncbi:recombinase family protein [Sphingomonas sp. RT2P30]|uniref:recombinase family protein n=1 Tax=Parasphingomonas halimpatiens TaxID=3096162 RepID=UPI002FCB39D8
MKSYFAYIRVSTVKQGEHGSSLQEQRGAIEAFAARQRLTISGWFEEMETAAKLGRGEFNKMISALERGRATGVIIHKIDRSARNLKDWARLGELIDRGIEVHFAHDNMDLTTRGGRLAADLQAVVAADFIRNLRDEVKKGRYGRLKQGFWPMAAPIGYLDTGRAKAKEVDPHLGPLIQLAFELYGTGRYSLHMLRAELAERGLRTASGNVIPVGHTARILHNPFYVGIMRVGTTGEIFPGNHEPLVSRALFDRVQAILSGRLYPRTEIHRFLFRRLIKCDRCGRSLSGERQKGHVYYRCHDLGCRGVSISERQIDVLVRAELRLLQVDAGDVGEFRDVIRQGMAEDQATAGERAKGLERDLALNQQRMNRITDAVLDGTIDKATFDERKAILIVQKLEIQERQRHPDSTKWQKIAERFELGLAALQGYEIGNDDEKRQVLQSVSSNLVATGKQPVFPMFSPFQELRNWTILNDGEPVRGAVRKPTRDHRREQIRSLIEILFKNTTMTQSVEDDTATTTTGFSTARPSGVP